MRCCASTDSSSRTKHDWHAKLRRRPLAPPMSSGKLSPVTCISPLLVHGSEVGRSADQPITCTHVVRNFAYVERALPCHGCWMQVLCPCPASHCLTKLIASMPLPHSVVHTLDVRCCAQGPARRKAGFQQAQVKDSMLLCSPKLTSMLSFSCLAG